MNQSPSEIGAEQRRWRWWHFALLAMLVLVALVPCDLPIARWFRIHDPSRTTNSAIALFADIAGGGLGVFLLLIAVVVIDRSKLGRLPFLVSSALGAGVLADIVKLCVCRMRPHSIDVMTATFTSTFGVPFQFFSASSGSQSFPSGHAATAFGFAVALGMIYPRARWPLILIAVATAIARVVVHAHYPTDVAAGAMLGSVWAIICNSKLLARPFAWSERVINQQMARWKSRNLVAVAPQNVMSSKQDQPVRRNKAA